MTYYRTGYVPGVFDLPHRGHLNLLRAARSHCACLIVGVVTDEGTLAYKGRRPVQDELTRFELLRSLRIVDDVMMQATTDPTPNLEVLRPDALFHGDDWTELREGHETLRRLGIAYVTVPYTPGVSTSRLIAQMVERGMATT